MGEESNSPPPPLRCVRPSSRYTRWGDLMADHDSAHNDVRPRTAVLTRGFDPRLSFGSARPAVFRASTYVFPSPEAAEHAFAITPWKTRLCRLSREAPTRRFSTPEWLPS